jgi:hypothetical protein
VKVIIEEGDVGGLAPGVYDADVLGAFVDCQEWNEVLKAGVHIDMAQKPKPLPITSRDLATQEIVRFLIQNAIQHVVKSFTNHVKPTDPPPVATCDKTFADCKKHGNTDRYQGFVDVQHGHVPCPYAFGDPICTGVPRSTNAPPAMPDDYNDTPYYTCAPHPPTEAEKAMASLDDGFIGNVVFPKTAKERAQAKPKDCDVCYGTGRFKGMGGPCSEGCPAKEGK